MLPRSQPRRRTSPSLLEYESDPRVDISRRQAPVRRTRTNRSRFPLPPSVFYDSLNWHFSDEDEFTPPYEEPPTQRPRSRSPGLPMSFRLRTPLLTENRQSSDRVGESQEAPTTTEPINPILDDDAFKCPICTEVFAEPKFLPCCKRSICKQCETRIISGLRMSGHGNCPMCNSPRQIGRRGLGVNIDLRNAIETLKTRPATSSNSNRGCQECHRNVDPDDLCFCATCDAEKKICWRCGGRNHKGHVLDEFVYISLEQRQETVEALKKEFSEVKKENEKAISECNKYVKEKLHKAKEMYEGMLKDNFQTNKEFREKMTKLQQTKKQLAKMNEALREAHVNTLQLDEQTMEVEEILERSM